MRLLQIQYFLTVHLLILSSFQSHKSLLINLRGTVWPVSTKCMVFFVMRHTCPYSRTHVCTRAHTQTHVHTHVSTLTHPHVPTLTHPHAQTCMHTYTCPHTHAQTHMCTHTIERTSTPSHTRLLKNFRLLPLSF